MAVHLTLISDRPLKEYENFLLELMNDAEGCEVRSMTVVALLEHPREDGGGGITMNEEKAVDVLETLLRHTTTDADYAYDTAGGGVELVPGQDVADAIITAIAALREKKERRWIPVTERLPALIPCDAGTAYSEAVNVLTSGRKVITAIWDGTDFIADAEFWGAEGEEITHWTPVLLPLPELPKAAYRH